jgi:lipoate-protein ligase A
MTPCRLFVDPPAAGVWNMAVDEALLDDAAERGLASLRFYQWSQPTLSLGYFQRYAERVQHGASAAAPVVRRLSGGGALMHDHELTYAIALPASHPATREGDALYNLVHAALTEVLATRGIPARVHQTAAAPRLRLSASTPPAPGEPFLCFARRTPADVVVAPADSPSPTVKIAGSAQRRRRGAVLQHGAVLLETSPAAPELPGIAQCTTSPPAAADLVAPWSALIAAGLDLELVNAHAPPADFWQRCNDLAGKYSSPSWTGRR